MAQTSKFGRETPEKVDRLTSRAANEVPTQSASRVEPAAHVPTTPTTDDVIEIVPGPTLDTPQGRRVVEPSREAGGGISIGGGATETAELPTISRPAPAATAASAEPSPVPGRRPPIEPNTRFDTPEGPITVLAERGQMVYIARPNSKTLELMPRAQFDELTAQQPAATDEKPSAETTPATAREPSIGETPTRRPPADSLEPSREETAEDLRLCSLYDRLSLEERAFVSAQWDYDHRLECWQQRLAAKEEAPRIAAHRRWQTYGVVAVLLWYGGCCYGAYRDAEYARDRLEWLAQKAQKDSALKAAIEEVDRERFEYYRSLKEDDEQ